MPPRPVTSDSSNPIQLWADVGGTFTDCFLVNQSERRSLKVLSSGVVRGRVKLRRDNSAQVSLPLVTQVDFWKGAVYRVLLHGHILQTGRVARQTSASDFVLTPELDTPVPSEDELLIEFDPQWEAPVLAAHLLLDIPLSQSLPVLDVRLGTTRGTNALLTRSGARVGLVTTKGFGDCLEIGEQNRPDLFALTIHKREPLTRDILEVDERLTAQGEILHALDVEKLAEPLAKWLSSGVSSLAICLLHSHVNDVHERLIHDVARRVGFKNISVSSRVAPMIKLVSRAETTVLDAYLTPVVADYVARLGQQFNRHQVGDAKTRLRLMTSSGNLVDAESFRGGDSILSGPAGGVVALGKIADAYANHRAIGLDMGGTSTDVCRYVDVIPRDYESMKAGIRVLVPMMSIHTVAAGGGSICDVVEGRMTVGPQSAGASPGPACYGRGGPLTVTDLNVILGRLPADRFPFPLDLDAARARLREVNAKLGSESFAIDEDAAAGFLTIAVTHMAEAVRTVSTAQGSDPRDFTLVGFGGAAGGHLCAIADALQMNRILDHRDASLLSALGIGLADIGRIRTRGVYRLLEELDAEQWQVQCESVQQETIQALAGEREVIAEASVRYRFETDVRYQGTEAALTLLAHPFESLAERFHEAHRAAFGYDQPNRKVEIATVRCEGAIPTTVCLEEKQGDAPERRGESIAERTTQMYCEGRFQSVPIFLRTEVSPGQSIRGPAIVVDDQSTLVIDPGWVATKDAFGSFEIKRSAVQRVSASLGEKQELAPEVDAVTIEVVARRMQGIADSMGELLRRTAASVNIRQRLDYSCAIFTADGQLIANAPHVPVHLGAMGHTVREIRKAFPTMSAGDVYISNNPYAGGSHLPDVTVVTPVFCEALSVSQRQPDFYVASRAHHAEIGGKTPGSMPPDGKCLAEEGVVIDTFALRRDGVDHIDELKQLLSSGPYPSRDPGTNLADIAAQRAAGMLGCNYLSQLVAALGSQSVSACVDALFRHANGLVQHWIQSLDTVPMSFQDSLDDGTKIAATLQRHSDRLRIDFTGTAPVHPGCFNATPAIVTAATIYVLRCVIGGTLPMNDGMMSAIDLVLPIGLLNPPKGKDATDSPAVVAGNVETSMRIVDCLLGALKLAAASQGTMNNVLIGDATFGYYETIGGGSGATAEGVGASGVHVHMTNTRITDPEVYESRYPVRLWRFELRKGSGGAGANRGGDGLVRELEFLRPLSLAMITNRRGTHQPWGISGGQSGEPGENILTRASGEVQRLGSAVKLQVDVGDRLTIKTPGGGGWGDEPFVGTTPSV